MGYFVSIYIEPGRCHIGRVCVFVLSLLHAPRLINLRTLLKPLLNFKDPIKTPIGF